VLDAACGSGNFLYLALHALKDLEHRAQIDAEMFGFPKQLDILTGTDNVLGIETNEYAAELARVTVWIGDIQWCQRNGRPINKNPILSSLDGIAHRDALLNADGSEAAWPEADVILGNPPFLGDKMMRGELGAAYVETLRRCYQGRVPGGADLVCYWFDKARQQIENGKAQAAGLVSTNSIRQKRNRVVLENLLQTMPIFEAWSDEDWFDAGTAVRVSLVCFGDAGLTTVKLAGEPVAVIHADLTASADALEMLDLTQAKPLLANKGCSFFGLCLAGPFKVDTATALVWLQETGNPNGRPNSDVVRPIYNGSDITRRWAGNWVVDFAGLEQEEAADYLEPFAYVEEKVKPLRINNNRAARAEKWWQHGEKRPGMRIALAGLTHYIATPETAKHRFFVKFPVQVAPEHSLIVIPRQDDITLGILSSRIHCVWALAKGGTLEDRPRYNASLTFETFPFPVGFDLKSESITENETFNAIALAAADLNTWREKWLNPEGWLDWLQIDEELAAGFPARPSPKPEHASDWKKRTLTNLYNEMPAGLKLRHESLDKAVAAAYGWNDYTPDMSNPEILQRLLQLNLAR
jgi:type II restriction/modification system DNA methylase subunit YeeA